MYSCVFLLICVCIMCVQCVWRQKRALDPLQLELHMVLTHLMDAGNQIWALCKSHRGSYPQSHLFSTPDSGLFCFQGWIILPCESVYLHIRYILYPFISWETLGEFPQLVCWIKPAVSVGVQTPLCGTCLFPLDSCLQSEALGRRGQARSLHIAFLPLLTGLRAPLPASASCLHLPLSLELPSCQGELTGFHLHFCAG